MAILAALVTFNLFLAQAQTSTIDRDGVSSTASETYKASQPSGAAAQLRLISPIATSGDANRGSFRPALANLKSFSILSSRDDSQSPSREIASGDTTLFPPPAHPEPRFSFGIRGSFCLRENDLKLTSGTFPNFAAGAFGQFRLGRSQQIRPVGEWWSFTPGVQLSDQPARKQTINTQVSAVVAGGEYVYRLGGFVNRFSVGGGAYLARWSVDSVNSVTLIPSGTARASGTSQWNRMSEGALVNFRISRRLELESRWIHSSYGYERLPVNVVLLGAGWRF